MTKLTISSLFSSAALALALVTPATATTVTLGGTAVAGQGLESSITGATTTTFNNLVMPASYHLSGTPNPVIVIGNQTNQHLQPTNDTSAYVTTGTGSITDSLGAGITSFGFYWGSVDTYNTFSITETNGNTATTLSLTGAQFASRFNVPVNGNASYFVNFGADAGETFSSATFSSTTNSFEFDNVATATPEPASIGMLAGGLLIMAGALRRRKA